MDAAIESRAAGVTYLCTALIRAKSRPTYTKALIKGTAEKTNATRESPLCGRVTPFFVMLSARQPNHSADISRGSGDGHCYNGASYVLRVAKWYRVSRVYLRLVSSASACVKRSHTPSRRHREKRIYTVCQRPNALGRSRHGQPVRPIQRTASTNRRLSAAVRPGSPRLPGRMDSIRAHRSSLNNVRITLPRLSKRQDVNTFDQM